MIYLMAIDNFLNRAEEQEEEVNPLLQKREEEIAKLYNQMCEVCEPHMYLSAFCLLACTLQPVPKLLLASHMRLKHLVNVSCPFILQVADLNLTFHDAIKAPQVEIDSIMDNLSKAEDQVDLVCHRNCFIGVARNWCNWQGPL